MLEDACTEEILERTFAGKFAESFLNEGVGVLGNIGKLGEEIEFGMGVEERRDKGLYGNIGRLVPS